MKKCTKCEKEKEDSEFSIHSKTKDGLHTHCKVCRNKDEKEKYSTGIRKKKVYSYTYEKWIKSEYKLSIEDYNSIVKRQNGKCAICEVETSLVVDHCHETEIVRGLLCTKCNTGLGKFKDSATLLEKAIQYLKRVD